MTNSDESPDQRHQELSEGEMVLIFSGKKISVRQRQRLWIELRLSDSAFTRQRVHLRRTEIGMASPAVLTLVFADARR